MDESYRPLLNILGQRQESDLSTLIWTAVALLSLFLLLLGAYLSRKMIRRRREHTRGFERLQKLGDEKDLDYVEQATADRIAQAAGLQNPAQLLTSIDAFDRAVAIWMAGVWKMPWLQMEEQVERLTSLRKKIGFRYSPPGRPPPSTRELLIGQEIYILAGGQKGSRLLSAPIVDLDDLAIRTEPFRHNRRPVRLRKQADIWAFAWAEDGRECRFKTRVLKEVERPAPYLMLQHGDALIYDEDREIFSCDLDLETVAERLPVSQIGRATPSPTLFEREGGIEALSICLLGLSGSGFVLSTDAQLEVNDLVRLGDSDAVPGILHGRVGRAVKVTATSARFRFVKLPNGDREAVLNYVAPRISSGALRGKKAAGKSPALN